MSEKQRQQEQEEEGIRRCIELIFGCVIDNKAEEFALAELCGGVAMYKAIKTFKEMGHTQEQAFEFIKKVLLISDIFDCTK